MAHSNINSPRRSWRVFTHTRLKFCGWCRCLCPYALHDRNQAQAANKNLLHDLTECEKLAEDERDALQQTLHATRTEKERVGGGTELVYLSIDRLHILLSLIHI